MCYFNYIKLKQRLPKLTSLDKSIVDELIRLIPLYSYLNLIDSIFKTSSFRT